MNRRPGIASLAICVLSLFLFPVYACAATLVKPAATAFIVVGHVTAPGGIIASNDKTGSVLLARVLDFFVPSAEAKLSGLLPVPNGTSVELVKMGDRGGTSAPIATTTTRYGRYQFNLSALRLTVSPRLIVRVSNVATGAQMRAFVTDKTVSINPVSETAVRMVLDTVVSTQGGTLGNFTVTELEDFFGSLDLLTSSINMRTDADIESSILAVRNAVSDNRGIVNFLTACARPGQTSTGPGDIGNYFPFTRGASWTYTVRESEDGVAARPFTNTVKINGARLINGVATTVFSNSNPDGDGKAGNDFYRKTSIGVFDWEIVKDGDRNKPYRTVRFPAAPGSSFQQSLGDMGVNSDLDKDGILERFNFTMTTTVIGLETVRVPAGDLRNSLKIRTVITGSAMVSSTRLKITITATGVEWYTKNLGLAKVVATYRTTYGKHVWKDTSTQELTKANGFPFTGDFPFDRTVTLDVDPNDIIYDSVSGKLFASVRSSAVNYTNNVVVIDPNTGTVEAAIPVGNNPGALALSGDGQFLYVGLGGDGEQGSILQVSIPTLTAEAEWPLSDEIYVSGYVTHRYARDIAVQPGHPEVIAVVTDLYPFQFSNSGWDVRLINNGVEHLATTSTTSILNYIFFGSDANVAYGHTSVVDYVLAVTPDDITTIQSYRHSLATALCFLDDNYFMSTGEVINAADGTHIGNISFGAYGSPYSGDADPATARVAFAHQGNTGDTIQVFDANTFEKADEIFVPLEYYKWRSKFVMASQGLYALQIIDTWSDMQRRVVLAKKGTAYQ